MNYAALLFLAFTPSDVAQEFDANVQQAARAATIQRLLKRLLRDVVAPSATRPAARQLRRLSLGAARNNELVRGITPFPASRPDRSGHTAATP